MQAEDWLSAHGLALPTNAADARRILMAWATELAMARKGQRARDEGEPVDTPEPVELPVSLLPADQQAATKGHRMRDAFDAWKAAARRPEKTVKAFERHLRTFEAMAGNPPLSTLRRSDAMRFRDSLQQWAVDNQKTAVTADNVLTSVKAMAGVAWNKEWMEVNPFDRLVVRKGGKDSEGREPWTPEEVVTLFNARLFTSYELPEGDSMATKAGADAAYWVPLLAAYTGARPSELCQLWTDDISEGAGGLVVEFRNNASRGQRLKDKKETKGGASWRAVPIHSELIRLC
jgi:integrase